MGLSQYRGALLMMMAVLVLAASIPIINAIVHSPSAVEAYSELWALGPNHTIAEFPLQMKVDEEGKIILGVRNRLNYPANYLLKVKFRNEDQPLPDGTKNEPSPLPSLNEFRFSLENGETWETWLNFTISDALFSTESCLVKTIIINDAPLSVNLASSLNPVKKGFYYQLFFELWLYDSGIENFRYHGRFVSIWLNLIQ